MPPWIDARIPVFLDAAPAMCAEAVLAEVGRPVPSGPVAVERFAPGLPEHAPGCACCGPRAAAAEALGRLFLARARGTVPFFRQVRVLARPEALAEVRAALAADPLVAARFRPG